ncbi:MAG: 5'/3'-nucleotidase SurE [Epsilonproteobacteria bacterium]|nr:MAG: 5'/3'-nucleotidase SurE [Campylobacterota bacterium]
MKNKRIFLTNDDGWDAKGLKKLIEALEPIAQLIIVAPATEKSASAHSMTLTRPLKLIGVDDEYYKMDDGTPTDCVFVGLNNLYADNNKPDLVISGINVGSNMGEDITYSGTVAGASEAVLQGVPAVSISQVFNDLNNANKNAWEYELAMKTIKDIAIKILNDDFPLGERKLLNINIPPCSIEECKGIQITNAGYREYGNDSHRYVSPRGEEVYWIGLHPLIWTPNKTKSCDFEAVKDNFVSITPIQLDMTSYNDIDKLKEWIK